MQINQTLGMIGDQREESGAKNEKNWAEEGSETFIQSWI